LLCSLTHIPLGSLQRVQLEVIFLHFLFHVGGKVAGSLCPFHRRLTIGLTVGTSLVVRYSITPFAGLYDGIASPTVVGTAALLHEDTFRSYFNSLTNHGTQPPFLWINILDFGFIG